MKTYRAIGLALALAILPACGHPLPAASVEVLSHADTFEIYRLEPHADAPPADSFHGHQIIGRKTVTDSKARERIWNIVDDGVRTGGTQSKCFNPRHGLHATRGAIVVDLVICYECGEVDVLGPGGTGILATADVQHRLDAEFAAVGLTRPVGP